MFCYICEGCCINEKWRTRGYVMDNKFWEVQKYRAKWIPRLVITPPISGRPFFTTSTLSQNHIPPLSLLDSQPVFLESTPWTPPYPRPYNIFLASHKNYLLVRQTANSTRIDCSLSNNLSVATFSIRACAFQGISVSILSDRVLCSSRWRRGERLT